MNKLQCKVCGGQIELQDDDRGLCLNCGTAYSLNSMRKMFEGVKVSVTGSSEDVEQWRQLLDRYYSAGDFTEAERIAKKMLEATPSDAQANLIYDELQVLKYFDVKNGVVKSYTGTARKITIPSFITEIEARTFAKNQYIEEIILPDTVTVIEESLFEDCINLKYVQLPANLSVISPLAFKNCYSLESAEIPVSVSEIGQEAFLGCSKLKGEVQLENIVSIGERAFFGCKKLLSFHVSGGITKVSDSMLEGCSGLVHIDIPTCVTSIGTCAFAGCEKITQVDIPDNVVEIEDGAFIECHSLKSITIPAKVQKLGLSLPSYRTARVCDVKGVFAKCISLRQVHWSCQLKTIAPLTFSECSSLTEVELPYGLKVIGYGAFSGCISLTQIQIPSSVTEIDNQKPCAYSGSVSYPIFEGCTNLVTIEYPDRFEYTVLKGSKLYEIMEERKKSGCCPLCGAKLSFWNGRCTGCGKY